MIRHPGGLSHIYLGGHDIAVLLQLLIRVEDRSRIRCLPETQLKDVIQQTSAILGRTSHSWVNEESNRFIQFYCPEHKVCGRSR